MCIWCFSYVSLLCITLAVKLCVVLTGSPSLHNPLGKSQQYQEFQPLQKSPVKGGMAVRTVPTPVF